MDRITYIKSVSIILERSSGEVLLCKRNSSLSTFPSQWVFPGGKVSASLDENWIGDEQEVLDSLLREMYEEIGVLPGTPLTIPVEQRNRNWLSVDYDDKERRDFLESMKFLGRKQTPLFISRSFDAAYFHVKHNFIDSIDPQVDGSELVDLIWITPEDAIEKWEKMELRIPPPILHLLRTMKEDYENLSLRTLVETGLPIGLQTKVEFAPGIVAIPMLSQTAPPFISTNLMVISSNDEIILVDPGANDTDHLTSVLASLPVDPKYIIITHHHKDHWEGLAIIEDFYPSTTVLAHRDTIDKIESSLKKQLIPENITVGKKNLIIIESPGHTSGHISIFDENTSVLLAGDHLVGVGSAVLDPESGNMIEYFESTYKLLELNSYLILPAHGPPIYNPKDKLEEYIKHRTEREESIKHAILEGSKTLDDIVKVVYTDVPQEMWEYAKRNIQLHIDKLVKEKQIPALPNEGK